MRVKPGAQGETTNFTRSSGRHCDFGARTAPCYAASRPVEPLRSRRTRQAMTASSKIEPVTAGQLPSTI
jgi:hypothetical protein